MERLSFANNVNTHSPPGLKTRFENSAILLNGNILRLKGNGAEVLLSKNQSKLLACLINEINEKESIIDYIWSKKKCKSKENSYSQLVYKTKLLLETNGFPKNFIMTIPRYGLCLNKAHSHPLTLSHETVAQVFNDQNACV